MNTKRQSVQARAASQIRRLLKKLYPSTKWAVTSSGFAGGNGVRISWEGGPTEKEVEEITSPYQLGEFNRRGVYDYTNSRPDLPQVKYVIFQREQSKQTREALIGEFEEKWGITFNNRDDFHRKWVGRKFEETAF